MKIIFICGCLEPGKDGVGDYTRRLAGELIRQGVQVRIIALNDKFIEEEKEALQIIEKVDVSTYRIPEIWNVENKVANAKRWVEQFDPTWLSLQFVPYSFQDKGLPFNLVSQLKQIGSSRNWQIMFHELWIGMNKESSTKDLFVGNLQKLVIKNLIKKIKPKVIHTQTNLYINQLEKLGFKSFLLPLVSNIPYFVRAKKTKKQIVRSKSYFVLFGGIHYGAPIEEFVKELSIFCKQKNTTIALVTVGRNGKELTYWNSVWESYGFEVVNMGEQSVESISEILCNAQIGLCTTPFVLVEKSGSVAAMQEHKLSVICISRAWTPFRVSNVNVGNGIIEYKKENLMNQLIEIQRKKITQVNISNVALSFIDKLKKDN